jgi:hypothetical protein
MVPSLAPQVSPTIAAVLDFSPEKVLLPRLLGSHSESQQPVKIGRFTVTVVPLVGGGDVQDNAFTSQLEDKKMTQAIDAPAVICAPTMGDLSTPGGGSGVGALSRWRIVRSQRRQLVSRSSGNASHRRRSEECVGNRADGDASSPAAKRPALKKMNTVSLSYSCVAAGVPHSRSEAALTFDARSRSPVLRKAASSTFWECGKTAVAKSPSNFTSAGSLLRGIALGAANAMGLVRC